MRTEDPKRIYLGDYLPPPYLVEAISLEFELRPRGTRVRSVMAVRANPAAANPGSLVLDGDDLRLGRIALNQAELGKDRYRLDDNCLEVFSVPEAFELEIVTELDPAENSRLEGLYLLDELFCTQCEAQGFRRITFFPDRPDVLSVYTVRISAPKATCPVLLSNGNRIEVGEIDDGLHFATWHDPHPKPAYLFALAAGRLNAVEDRHQTASGRNVRLQIFVAPGNESKVEYAMSALKRCMKWDEEAFGLEYDLDQFMIVAVRSFNMGAMENKGLNIFNSALLLASPETATDTDYERIEAVVAHEYFHNWTGNRVTCRDWFQLCLKEGLTVFRDQLFSGDMRDTAVRRIEDVKRLKARQFPEDDGPLAHPPRPDNFIEVDNFYTATVYEKGAEICRMLYAVLGKEGFRKGLDLYFERHDGQAVTVEDFVDALGAATGTDLRHFLTWYRYSGRPEVRIETNYDTGERSLTITFHQSSQLRSEQGDSTPRPIPICMGILDGDGNEIPLDPPAGARRDGGGVLFVLRQSKEVVRFENLPKPGAVSILRGFSAPVSLARTSDLDNDLFILRHDTDQFNRWDAAQRAAARFIHDTADLSAGPVSTGMVEGLAEAMRHMLLNQDSGEAFKALVITLPDVGDLAQTYFESRNGAYPDYGRLFQAKHSLKIGLASALYEEFLSTYWALETPSSGGPEAGPAGSRALRLACLSFLAVTTSGPSMVSAHYERAQTMTDRLGALTLAVHFGLPSSDTLLQDFYTRFQHDPLVIDKWFSVQSTAPAVNVLDRIQTLQGHAAYDGSNPNRVRALIGGYAFSNPYRFHCDGERGYTFLANEALRLDKINPQIAARMLSALEGWPRLVPENQTAVRGALQQILATEDLSPNLFEIAVKSMN